MTTRIIVREKDGVEMVSVKGRLALGDSVSAFREIMNGLVGSAAVDVLLDLRDVSCLDTCGLGELIAFANRIAGTGGTVKLLHTGTRALDPLQITKLLTAFEMYDSELQALASFHAESRCYTEAYLG